MSSPILRLFSLLAVAASFAVGNAGGAAEPLRYEGQEGPGKGRHVVLLTGDEEYRSEEALTQLARILAVRHGFTCTVLFAIDPQDGSINPNQNDSLPNSEVLADADAIVMAVRFRQWPDEAMKNFEAAYLAGKPMIGLRTSTHAFRFPPESKSAYKRYDFQSSEWTGGFGRQVLGETWVGHLGKNHQEATLGVVEPGAQDDPLLNGVGEIFADTGAYHADPQPDATILLRAKVLAGTTPDAPAEATGKNDPPRPLAWHRLHENEAGETNRVFCTTMGSSTDMRDEDFRRLLVNSVYWGLGMDVPEKADVQIVGDFEPSEYRMNGYRKGVKPQDLKLD